MLCCAVRRERDVSEVVIDTGGVEFHEGQSFGVLPPGTKINSKGKEVPEVGGRGAGLRAAGRQAGHCTPWCSSAGARILPPL